MNSTITDLESSEPRDKEWRQLSMRILNRGGGKKIDLQHSQKQSIVGNHMLNLNSDDPVNLERGTVEKKEVLRERVQSATSGRMTESHF